MENQLRVGVFMSEELRRKAKASAAEAGMTFNQWLVDAVEQKLWNASQAEEMRHGRLGTP